MPLSRCDVGVRAQQLAVPPRRGMAPRLTAVLFQTPTLSDAVPKAARGTRDAALTSSETARQRGDDDMARTHAMEPAVYDRTPPTHGRNRGAMAGAAVGALVLLAMIVWSILGVMTTAEWFL